MHDATQRDSARSAEKKRRDQTEDIIVVLTAMEMKNRPVLAAQEKGNTN